MSHETSESEELLAKQQTTMVIEEEASDISAPGAPDSPTKQPTDSPTKNPSESPAKKPTDSPAKKPTDSPARTRSTPSPSKKTSAFTQGSAPAQPTRTLELVSLGGGSAQSAPLAKFAHFVDKLELQLLVADYAFVDDLALILDSSQLDLNFNRIFNTYILDFTFAKYIVVSIGP